MHTCSCGCQKPESTIRSQDWSQLESHALLANQLLSGKSASFKAALGLPAGNAAPPSALTQFHLTDDGGALISSSFASGTTGDIVLRGNIGPLPYELHLRVDLSDSLVTVTAELTKPFQAGPFVWKFSLGGILRDSNNKIISATQVTPVDVIAPQGPASLGLNWWCVLKCGGVAILGILVDCLPSLTGGIPGYVACVTSQAGSGAAGIASCIASQCA